MLMEHRLLPEKAVWISLHSHSRLCRSWLYVCDGYTYHMLYIMYRVFAHKIVQHVCLYTKC